jgi:hypothetical protein
MGSEVERRRASSSTPDEVIGGRMYTKECTTFLDIGERLSLAACT